MALIDRRGFDVKLGRFLYAFGERCHLIPILFIGRRDMEC